MKAVIQRVNKASVEIDGKILSQIDKGYLILLGIAKEDTNIDVDKLAGKIAGLRIMADKNSKMNLSVKDSEGEILVVSQFTLVANLKGGRRPDFFNAMEPKTAERLYNLFTKVLIDLGLPVKTGRFSAYMKVGLINDGPVTFILDSKDL